jgi:hypothetical protein
VELTWGWASQARSAESVDRAIKRVLAVATDEFVDPATNDGWTGRLSNAGGSRPKVWHCANNLMAFGGRSKPNKFVAS